MISQPGKLGGQRGSNAKGQGSKNLLGAAAKSLGSKGGQGTKGAGVKGQQTGSLTGGKGVAGIGKGVAGTGHSGKLNSTDEYSLRAEITDNYSYN